MTVVFFILIIVALILVHELGHFLVAKLFRIWVQEFGVFFPPRIFALRKGETEYSFNLLPLGGFVRIFGENASEGGGNPRSMASKSRPVQASVVVAGVLCNVLFAWVLFSVGYSFGLPALASTETFGEVKDVTPMIVGVRPNSPAERVGLKPEDVIISLETGKKEVLPEGATALQVREFIGAHQDQSLLITVTRDGEEKIFLASAEEGFIEGRKALGVDIDDVGVLQLPVHLAVLQGVVATKDMTISSALSLAGFFSRLVRGAADFSSVAGPIGIVSFGALAVGQGFAPTIVLTALISINLAIINLIPIPGLDGGRLFIIAIESIFRRPVPEYVTTRLTIFGLGLLVLLMLVVSYHDIARLVS
ncbi:hypothetical protein A2943_03255 [Candidatus Adlerbacteria bacterium RIFCSPLOWO2_01_FULL_51_16]|uniref:PDZ domain-containing protein n=1 Tax=Candidatus Adlerbacteria bacterium RIFCSPLOWO2_01_FULL_51_16 TaxID=1797243 RepID=A0A1F4XEP3_9BACT|nr:MAG: hypothetical protein A2943_03255 [Candidatus Adlerbacteria bacterium RIFCSPLOWO2_01_FULL_51_16]